MYLKTFEFLTEDEEYHIKLETVMTGYNTKYPLDILYKKELKTLNFNNITIFYGGNGSGKSTILNIINEKIKGTRSIPLFKNIYFQKYLEYCQYDFRKHPVEIKIITSDDVFDYLFDIRTINNGIERGRENLYKEYQERKNAKITSMEDYSLLKDVVDARNKTMSTYTRGKLNINRITEQSNGESALMFFEKEIKENSIYLLDEPENSLSAESQIKLAKFISDSSRFYKCQFIISTHSPFFLAIKDALVYDIDTNPATIKNWTELPNVRNYYNFFKEHEDEFNS